MSLEQDMARLAAVPIFSVLSRDALRLLAFAAEPRALKQGELLFRRGEPAEGAHLVVTGSISLEAAREENHPPAPAGPGTLLYERALLIPLRYAARGVAAEPTTVLRIGRTPFRRMLTEHPEPAQQFRKIWADDLDARLGRIRTAIQR